MNIFEWAPLGAVLWMCIFVPVGYSFFKGISVISARRRGETREAIGLARFYVKAAERRLTEIGFYLLFFLVPIIAIFIPGLILATAEAISLMIDNWYAFLGGAMLSFSLPFCYMQTGEEQNELKYEREQESPES
ncbi:MAG: hypothetical protein EAX95_15735 [Candidatus Thorarchaeota archaeon]|nr:hypothetical protein [Candidatus Thorarchaeota archaeon]